MNAVAFLMGSSLILAPLQVRDTQQQPVPQLGAYLPAPLSRPEFEYASQTLVLSDAQREQAERLFDAYVAETQSIRTTNAAEFDRTRHDASVAAFPSANVQSIPAIARFIAVEDRVSADLESAENRLFEQISLTLAESQRTSMVMVAARRNRTRARFINDLSSVGAALVDLVEHLRSMGIARTDYDGLDRLLDQYVLNVGQVAKDLDDRYAHRRLRSYELDAIILDNSVSHPEAADAARHEREGFLSHEASDQRRLATINLDFANQIATLLPQPMNDRFIAAVRATAFRHLYPDATTPEYVVRQILKAENITPETRDSIATMTRTSENRKQYDSISRDMERLSLDWEVHMAQTFNIVGYDQYRDRMREMRERRSDLNQRLVQQVLDALTPEVRTTAQASVDAWKKRIDKIIAAWLTDEFPPR